MWRCWCRYGAAKTIYYPGWLRRALRLPWHMPCRIHRGILSRVRSAAASPARYWKPSAMNNTLSVYLAIAAMALVTWGCRCGGYLLFSRITPSPALRRALAYLPGCIFIAYVVPALMSGPPQNWGGAAVTMVTMATSRNVGLSIAAGVVSLFAIDGISGFFN
ncbi:MAG: hypothetical protein B7Z77_06610 [Acidocella sp. 20-58-15]|nr:MAG: hypothetical protein B7Z77_06610 [Acidocella sp. 20-58-15]